MALHRSDECSKRLAEIPGVGPVGASLLMMKTPDPGMFKSGRDFAAWKLMVSGETYRRQEGQTLAA